MLLRALLISTVFIFNTQISCAQIHPNFDTHPNYVFSNSDVGPNSFQSAKRDVAPFGLSSEWITDSNSGLATTEATATLPLLFISRPPPLVKVGFGYTNLFASEELGLPDDLYEYTIGVSGVRKINDRWVIRSMLGVGFATDNSNTSSDAWQFRGGVFGIYNRNENISWTFGALATGRDDLPVIPAVGAIWLPNPSVRFDLTFPKPRVNFLIGGNEQRQQWVYLGGSINGTTWGYQRSEILDDRLTYKNLRIVAGWESRSGTSAKMPFAIGKTIQAEIGYVFSRKFEFEAETRVEELDDSFVVGLSTKF